MFALKNSAWVSQHFKILFFTKTTSNKLQINTDTNRNERVSEAMKLFKNKRIVVSCIFFLEYPVMKAARADMLSKVLHKGSRLKLMNHC